MTFSKQPSHQAVMIDNATLRGALIALGLLDSRHSEPNEPIKVFDVHVASAEVLIESMLLYDHIYIPKVHENYPETIARIQSVIGRELIQELPLVYANGNQGHLLLTNSTRYIKRISLCYSKNHTICY